MDYILEKIIKNQKENLKNVNFLLEKYCPSIHEKELEFNLKTQIDKEEGEVEKKDNEKYVDEMIVQESGSANAIGRNENLINQGNESEDFGLNEDDDESEDIGLKEEEEEEDIDDIKEVEDNEDEEDNIKSSYSESYIFLMKQNSKYFQISNFLKSFLKRLIPLSDLFGSDSNLYEFERKLELFISMKKYETFSFEYLI